MSAAIQNLLDRGDLEKLIRRALLDPEIKENIEYSSVRSEAITETIRKNFDEVIAAVREEASVFQEVKAKADGLRSRWLTTHVPFKLHYFLGICIGVISLSTYLWFARVSGWGWPVRYPSFFAAVGGAVTLSIGALVWAEARRRRNNQLNDFVYRDYSEAQERVKAAKDKFDAALIRKGVVPAVREILNRATTPSYSALIKEFSASGLAEVFDSLHEVTTESRRKLDRLLRLPGGSIGLAGPRGAGKTTLLSLVCSPVGSEDRKMLGLVCAAPVEYNPREFLLTLFSLVCSHVSGPDEEDQRDDFSAARLGAFGSRPLRRVGVGCSRD